MTTTHNTPDSKQDASVAAVEGDAKIREVLEGLLEFSDQVIEAFEITPTVAHRATLRNAREMLEHAAAASSPAAAEPQPNHPFIVLSQDLFNALTTASHELKAAVEIGAANPIYAQSLTLVDTMLKYDAHRNASPAPAEPLQPEGEQENQ